MITAQDFINHVDAGLILAGFENGEYQWVGESREWGRYNYNVIMEKGIKSWGARQWLEYTMGVDSDNDPRDDAGCSKGGG